MRRADRLLQLVQALRRAARPITAAELAAELEVGTRTIYRDVATLQGARVPIEGEAGIGYVLRPGYDLPPMMFTVEELQAVVLGAQMVIARGDAALSLAARDVVAKVEAVLPSAIADQMWKAELLIPHKLEDGVSFGAHVPTIRQAIREDRKIRISYLDAEDRSTVRTIWPLGLYLFSHVTLICAWCETRENFRAFRSERVEDCELLADRFNPKGGALLNNFMAQFSRR